MLVLPPVALWALLYWQDRKSVATCRSVVNLVKEFVAHGWLLERHDIVTLANSAARRNHLILPVPGVDEILDEAVAGLFTDFEARSITDSSRELNRPLFESQIRQLRTRMIAVPAVRPDASTAFAIGAGIVLVLMGLLLYLPAAMHQPSPLEGMGSAGKMVTSLNSFWDELIGIVGTNVVGLVTAWFVSSRRAPAPEAIDQPVGREPWPFDERR